jgi:hypothetical protein
MERFVAVLLSILAGLGGGGTGGSATSPWQADLQIRSLTVSEAKGNLTAPVVVAAEFGEALATRVEVLLPVGVGIVTLGTGCVPGPNHTGISDLHGRVECTLGNMRAGTTRELIVMTTTPPNGVTRGLRSRR